MCAKRLSAADPGIGHVCEVRRDPGCHPPRVRGRTGEVRVVGLDLSLTKTGIADEDGTRTLSPGVGRVGPERLDWFRDRIVKEIHGADTSGPRCFDCFLPTIYGRHPGLVVLEGYSLGTARQQSHAHALGELGGIVRWTLWDLGIPYVDVSPATLKKYATGKGNAGKDAVLIAAVKRLAPVGDNNQADAWWLRAIGMDALGVPVVEMPKVNREALKGLVLPAGFGAVA